MKRVAVYHPTLSTANNTKHINMLGTDELDQLYVIRLVTTIPITNSLFTRIRDEHVMVQSHIDPKLSGKYLNNFPDVTTAILGSFRITQHHANYETKLLYQEYCMGIAR
jgi:hypothetical protein